MLQVLLGDLVIKSATDQTLGGVNCVLRVLDSLALSDISDETVSILSECDN